MKSINKLAAILSIPVFAVFAGCNEIARTEVLKEETKGGRMQVTSSQTFHDARGYARDIIVLRDSETGREYVSVMGAGVSEMTLRHNGKTAYMVEE